MKNIEYEVTFKQGGRKYFTYTSGKTPQEIFKNKVEEMEKDKRIKWVEITAWKRVKCSTLSKRIMQDKKRN